MDARILYAKGASVHGLWLTYLSAKRELMNQAWQQLSAWTAQGHLRPVIGHVFPLEKAAEAYRLLLEGKNFGKVVLKLALVLCGTIRFIVADTHNYIDKTNGCCVAPFRPAMVC